MSDEATADLTPFVPRLLLTRSADAPRHWRGEGTMALVDIAGFTSLSEQLARRGRVGAEDLVSTLTRIFTVLMSASDDGGDVVKFAGDAMLLWYDGVDHEAHACHAALTAQRALGVVGGVRLAGARARLRMSVGVHTGTFHFMLSGRETDNLVVAGPDLSRVLQLQDLAGAGQVLVSPDVAGALPASSVAPGPGDDARVLRRLPQLEGVTSSAYAGRAARTDLWRHLPAPFQRRPDLLGADSDHRRAAVGFVQVSGLDRLLVGDPSTAAAMVDALSRTVDDACGRTGVTLLDVDVARDGYRYFLGAGAPVAVEDSEGRLLRALLDICATDSALGVRAGASSGQVFAGQVGTTSRRTFSVMGDTTNLAARLTARAAPGQVLSSDTMLRRSQTAFTVTGRAGLTVKGKTEPVAVGVVTGVVGPRALRRGLEPTFVGREDELDLAQRLAVRAAGGRGGVLEVVGEPGLGKTRLAREAAERSGLRQVWVTADPYAEQVPFRALSQLLAPLLGIGPGDDEDAAGARLSETVSRIAPALTRWLPLLAPAVGARTPITAAVSELDPRFRTARFHDAVSGLLAVLLPEPVILVVDDAQWVDQTSAEALAASLGAVGTRPWVVVLTRRDQPGGLTGPDSPDTIRVPLPGLSPAAAQRLLSEVSGGGLRAARTRELVERAGGNAYFLLELATSADEQLPDTVEELIGLRIDDLDARDRDLLRHAAALGSRFPLALLTATTGGEPLGPTVLLRGLDAFVSVEDDTVAFRRELQREVAYGQLTFRRRREVHRAAVRAIEDRPDLPAADRLPLLSFHSFTAGLWPQAYAFSRSAAEQARDAFANDEAATFARRALEAGRRSGAPAEELGRMHVGLGDVLTLTGDHAGAVHALRAARRTLSDPQEVAEVVYRIGMVQRESGHLDAALASARRTSRLAEALPYPQGAQLSIEADLLRAGVRFWQGRCGSCQALTLATAARAEALPDGVDRTRLLARALALHDTAAIELEGRAGEHGELPLTMFARIGDLYNEGRFAVNVAVGEYYEGRWDRAVALYRRSLDLAERIGDVFSVAVAKMNIGEVLSLQGRDAEATELLTASVSELVVLDTALAAAHAALYLSVAHRLAGDLPAARRRLDQSASLFAEAGRDRGFSLDDHASRGIELLVAEGRYAEAEAAASSLVERSDPAAPLHRARALRTRALARHELGEPTAARADLVVGLEIARGLPLGYDAALGLLVLAGWTGDPGAQDEAVGILTRLGAEALLRPA